MRIAINGFGRIGRIFFRQAFGVENIEIVAINDLGNAEDLAYLLERDTVYGKYDKSVLVEQSGAATALNIGGQNILFFHEKDIANLPWKDLEVDIVIESTGVFDSFEKSRAHILAGAKKVLITAPAKDADSKDAKTVLLGINDNNLQEIGLISNASCTTNAAAQVIEVLREKLGIKKAVLNTVHALTATQDIVDGPVTGKDFRRGRAATESIVPSTTGAAIAVTRVVKELENKFDGIALRVPVICGSIADITFIASRETTVAEVNYLLRQASGEPRWQGILKVSDEQIVSSDIIGEPYGAIVDAGFTKVVDGDLVKVLVWYDNEWGYVSTLVKQVLKMTNN